MSQFVREYDLRLLRGPDVVEPKHVSTSATPPRKYALLTIEVSVSINITSVYSSNIFILMQNSRGSFYFGLQKVKKDFRTGTTLKLLHF